MVTTAKTPDYLGNAGKDEAPERIFLESTDSLEKMLLDIRSTIQNQASQQAALNKIIASQLETIKKFDEQQGRLSQIDQKIDELKSNLSGRVKYPTHFGSGFIFSIPIVGSILRAIFK
jgi:hypothetical protein